VSIFRRSKSKKAGKPAAGKAEEALGFATGDRRVEAEGHARHEKAEAQGTHARVTPEEVGEEEEIVRRWHGDVGLEER
jgi:uncharacterized protein YjbJ (UPF0337 family)